MCVHSHSLPPPPLTERDTASLGHIFEFLGGLLPRAGSARGRESKALRRAQAQPKCHSGALGLTSGAACAGGPDFQRNTGRIVFLAWQTGPRKCAIWPTRAALGRDARIESRSGPLILSDDARAPPARLFAAMAKASGMPSTSFRPFGG